MGLFRKGGIFYLSFRVGRKRVQKSLFTKNPKTGRRTLRNSFSVERGFCIEGKISIAGIAVVVSAAAYPPRNMGG